jgi:hypothetical protein
MPLRKQLAQSSPGPGLILNILVLWKVPVVALQSDDASPHDLAYKATFGNEHKKDHRMEKPFIWLLTTCMSSPALDTVSGGLTI